MNGSEDAEWLPFADNALSCKDLAIFRNLDTGEVLTVEDLDFATLHSLGPSAPRQQRNGRVATEKLDHLQRSDERDVAAAGMLKTPPLTTSQQAQVSTSPVAGPRATRDSYEYSPASQSSTRSRPRADSDETADEGELTSDQPVPSEAR